ncbi:MAG: carboxylating nicotinate-nucleotide diphosphorylase [Bryobacterales bacterium]|nr:carboxylating nicotinate-nucleotide diphosphorylase [Bryobacteraceae bacterium]MDW8353472.1 carboxylating nicotinate-nucleotide diphosphorylase [Bryobacterales bacterium]
MSFDVTHPDVAEAIRRALEEDIGPGDITSEACVPEDLMALGRFTAREPLVVAGVELLPLIYRARGGFDELRGHVFSGQRAEAGQVIAEVRARARTLLACERVALNFLQRLSGIATLARRFVEAVDDLPCRILDTRKTTPGLRRLEKMAAATGGVLNHRMGLYDAILIKNNHIAAVGGVRIAVERARARGLPVEVEVRTRQEIVEALAAGADRLLLDNMTPQQAAEEIRFIAGRATVEVSGGVTLDNVRAYAEAGPDYISAGAITHSARAVNINFQLEPLP